MIYIVIKNPFFAKKQRNKDLIFVINDIKKYFLDDILT
jgi:hypothetical protein